MRSLKKILNEQERADGMAQYRITRRRAEIERKRKGELRDTLGNLASLVDGDVESSQP